MHPVIRTARDGLLTFLYPTPCRVCGAIIESWDDGVACARCWGESVWPADAQACEKCGLPLWQAAGTMRCGGCEDAAFVRARACGPYRGAWRESVIWLKSNPHLASRLRQGLLGALGEMEAACGEPFDSVIPVPLHASRQAERGFNQAEVVARALAEEARRRLDRASLARVRATSPHRVGMDAEERAASMQGAFSVRARRLVTGRSLLLVDDVMTTAATAHAAAEALVGAGARRVAVITLARVSVTL